MYTSYHVYARDILFASHLFLDVLDTILSCLLCIHDHSIHIAAQHFSDGYRVPERTPIVQIIITRLCHVGIQEYIHHHNCTRTAASSMQHVNVHIIIHYTQIWVLCKCDLLLIQPVHKFWLTACAQVHIEQSVCHTAWKAKTHAHAMAVCTIERVPVWQISNSCANIVEGGYALLRCNLARPFMLS